MNKTIGVLGGMGTFATMHFLKYLTELSEPDEFRFILDNNINITERTRAYKEGIDISIELELAIGDLARAGAHFAVMPCNQVHRWYCKTRSCIPWLNIIEITSTAVKAGGYKHPMILGGYVTVKEALYSDYLPVAGYASKKENEKIYQAIIAIKQYRALRINARATIERVITDHKNDCDCVILGCTELPIAFNFPTWQGDIMVGDLPIIDSSLELAKVTIQHARGE